MSLSFAATLALLVIGITLFSAIYIKNIIAYGSPHPSCFETLGKERCLTGYIEKRNYMVKQSAHTRSAEDLWEYTTIWHGYMIEGATDLAVVAKGENGKNIVDRQNGLPTYANFLAFGLIAAIAAFLLSVRGARLSRPQQFMAAILITGVGVVFLKNLSSYYAYNIAMANQPRYLLTVIPIALVFAAFYFRSLFHRKIVSVVVFVVVVAITTQGGGISSFVVNSQANWFWPNSTIRDANKGLRTISQPFIKESQGPFGT